MTSFRLVAAGFVLGSVAASCYAVTLDPPQVASFLWQHDAHAYAAGLWWVTVAPVLLLGAGLAAGRTPWPWVGLVTVHLAVLLAVATRLRLLVPDLGWWAVGVVVAVGLASVTAAVRAPVRRTP